MQIFKTKKEQEPAITEPVDAISECSWVRLYEPSEAELVLVSGTCAIPWNF